MALVGSFLTATNIAGAVGGSYFGKGISGPTLRARVKPANPASKAISGVNSVMAAAVAQASTLTEAEVELWATYALTITKSQRISGENYNPSWQNAFVANYLNYNIANGRSSLPTTPPAGPFAGDTPAVTWTTPTAGELVVTASNANASDVVTALYWGRLPGYKGKIRETALRFKGAIQFTDAALSYTFTDITDGWRVVVGYKFINNLTGQSTNITGLLLKVIV